MPSCGSRRTLAERKWRSSGLHDSLRTVTNSLNVLYNRAGGYHIPHVYRVTVYKTQFPQLRSAPGAGAAGVVTLRE